MENDKKIKIITVALLAVTVFALLEKSTSEAIINAFYSAGYDRQFSWGLFAVFYILLLITVIKEDN